MTNAYQAVRDMNMPVKRAALQYGVPQTSLRDRVMGRIDPETVTSGPPALFSQEEEAKFIAHVEAMAELGYGYSRNEVIDKASNFATYLGKRDKDHPVSDRWYRGLMGRWPELKCIKPRSLEKYRAQATSNENVSSYFARLEATLIKLGLNDRPHCIYNVDEKGVQTEHSPPYIVCAHDSVTSARSSVTTVLGCGNALGTQMPPFFIFKGKRMRNELLESASHGVQGTVSESGWSNSAIFLEYLQTHFLKYVQRCSEEQHILLIFDGHKSHVTVPVINWAKEHNVSLFVLPAHTSHILQPLDVGCFGPMQRIYNAGCHKFLRANPASRITRYNVCALACAAYTPALSVGNLVSSFRRTGIFPFNPDEISEHQLAPSKAYISSENQIENDMTTHPVEEANRPEDFFMSAEKVILDKQTFEVKPRRNISHIISGTAITSPSVERAILKYQSETKKPRPVASKSTSETPAKKSV